MSGACDGLVRDASSGVAASLRAVDCVSNEATASAFTRLFGLHGALLPALTLLLTLYVGGFAVLLLTGRSRLSIGSLTPRMVMLGLVLTFTTSAVAYQGVVWNLAIGAPDQIAGVLMGAGGSATQLFAERIDILFNAIAEAASTVQAGPAPAGQGAFSANNLMWLSALLLMLGTVGVLVTARIALAVLLAVGPIFITFILFSGARGLFAGWLRGVVLTALTPLFAVLGGALMVELAVPVVLTLRDASEGVDGRAAMALFVIAAVHCALMTLAIRVASTMVSGWRVFGLAEGGRDAASGRAEGSAPRVGAPSSAPAWSGASRSRLVSGASDHLAGPGAAGADASAASPRVRNIIIPATASGSATRPVQPHRARGIGSRFAAPATSSRIHVK